MYGLLSKAYNNYRIQNDTREGYYAGHHGDAVILNLLEAIVTVAILMISFDIFLTEKLQLPYLALILFAFYIPFFGDIVALTILLYWVINVQNRSVLFSR